MTSTTLPRAKSARTTLATATIGVAILITGLLSSTAAFATHGDISLTGSNFEIDTDANLIRDHVSPSIDWASVTQTAGVETDSGSGDNSFGQGTKEDSAVPTVVSGSIPPNKSDLKAFGVFQEGTSSAGFLHLYWTRVQDPTGTTNMDFEFNQSRVLSANNVTPVRTIGDLLITYDLSQGGTHPTLGLRTWNGTSWSGYQALDNATAVGSINTSAITLANSDGLGALSPRTFGEASIRLSAILGSSCTSFGSAYLKSRSSDTFNSALKDFIAPTTVNITNCGAVNIVKTDDLGAPLNGATFTLYRDIAPIGLSHGPEDTVTAFTCMTEVTGICTISSVPFGAYWVVETTTPSGYTTAADQYATVSSGTTSVTLTFVDPRIILPTTITTAQSFVPNDSATVSVASGTLAGNVVFQLYTAADCAGTAVYNSGDVSITGTGSSGTAVERTVSSGNTTAYSTTGTNFSWKVTYTSTNGGQSSVTSNCVEHSSITINNG